MSTKGGDHWCELPLVEHRSLLLKTSSWWPSILEGHLHSWGVNGQWGHQSLWHQTTLASVNCVSLQAHTCQRHILQSTEQLDRWSNDTPCLFWQQSQHPFSCFYHPSTTQKMWETAWGKGFLDHFHQPTTLGTRELGDLACSCVFIRKEGIDIHCFLVSQISQMDYPKLKDPFRVQSIFNS